MIPLKWESGKGKTMVIVMVTWPAVVRDWGGWEAQGIWG